MSAPEKGIVPQGPSKSGYDPGQWFWESRKKGPSSAGTILFTALRVLDIPLQYYFLKSGLGVALISRLGGAAVTTPFTTPMTGIGLSPYHTLILGLAVGSSAKQIYWKLAINDTAMPLGFSTIVSVYNTLLNTFNTTLALWTLTSQQPTDQSSLKAFFETAPLTLPIGIALYTTGIFIEWYCEIQRKSFKSHPSNKNNPYSGGLFSLARHINYGGYTLWRAGYSAICGGWIWAATMAAWLAGDFCGRAIPSLDAYCEKRYGDSWEEVRRKVPYRLLPWIY